MSTYRVTGAGRKKGRKHSAPLWGGAAALILVGLCGVPLPGLVHSIERSRRLRVLRQQADLLVRNERDMTRLERIVPPLKAKVLRELKKAYPRVEDLFTLRDLLLSMGRAAGVSLEEAIFSPHVPASRLLPGEGERLFRTEMEIKGRGDLDHVILLAGMIEAAGSAFTLIDLDLSPSGAEDPERVEFRFELEALFRGPGGPAGFLGADPGAGTTDAR